MKALLLLCSGWVERLGGREEVEKRANSTWGGSMAPFAVIHYCADLGRLSWLSKSLVKRQ